MARTLSTASELAAVLGVGVKVVPGLGACCAAAKTHGMQSLDLLSSREMLQVAVAMCARARGARVSRGDETRGNSQQPTICVCARARAHTHARTHARMRAQARAYTHSHTNARSFVRSLCPWNTPPPPLSRRPASGCRVCTRKRPVARLVHGVDEAAARDRVDRHAVVAHVHEHLRTDRGA